MRNPPRRAAAPARVDGEPEQQPPSPARARNHKRIETSDQLRTKLTNFSARQRSIMDTSEQWFTLDNRDGPIWGSRAPGSNPGSPTGEWPCRRHIDVCGSGAFQASTSFCIHCDAPPPDKPELSTEAAAAFERVLSAEPELRAAVDIVEVLRQLVRPTDQLCHGCLWESIIKPMVRPYLGYGRGYPPKSAKDPNPERAWEIISAAEMWARGDTGLPPRPRPRNGCGLLKSGMRSPMC